MSLTLQLSRSIYTQGGAWGAAGGEAEGSPGWHSVSGTELEVAPWSLDVLGLKSWVTGPRGRMWKEERGRALTSDLSSFSRALGRVPQAQGRWKLPRGAWSPWRRIPSTPPGRKVSQGGAGAASAVLHPGLGSLGPRRAVPDGLAALLPAASEFPVVVQRTEAATRCQLKGPYLLVLGQDTIQLREASSPQPLYTWPYRFLRKFGSDKVRVRECPAGKAGGWRGA